MECVVRAPIVSGGGCFLGSALLGVWRACMMSPRRTLTHAFLGNPLRRDAARCAGASGPMQASGRALASEVGAPVVAGRRASEQALGVAFGLAAVETGQVRHLAAPTAAPPSNPESASARARLTGAALVPPPSLGLAFPADFLIGLDLLADHAQSHREQHSTRHRPLFPSRRSAFRNPWRPTLTLTLSPGHTDG